MSEPERLRETGRWLRFAREDLERYGYDPDEGKGRQEASEADDEEEDA